MSDFYKFETTKLHISTIKCVGKSSFKITFFNLQTEIQLQFLLQFIGYKWKNGKNIEMQLNLIQKKGNIQRTDLSKIPQSRHLRYLHGQRLYSIFQKKFVVDVYLQKLFNFGIKELVSRIDGFLYSVRQSNCFPLIFKVLLR